MEQITNKLKSAKQVCIFTHMRPDGDAIGSALALSYALEYMGVKNEVCVETEIPQNLAFLEDLDKIQRAPKEEFDLLVTVDCSDEQRLGALQDTFYLAKRKKIDTVNIDHHVSNTRFAKYNFVRTCAANCMNIASFIEYMGAPFDRKIATYLMVGLLTDSGNFSHDDVDEESLLLAAKLVKAGADIRYLNDKLFKSQKKERAALFAKTMSGIRYYHDNRFAAVYISMENMKQTGADQSMTEGFVDFPLNIEGVEIAASILEVKRGQYRISLRSKEYADVNKMAATYGGGGHIRAAGCMMFGDIEEVFDKLSYLASQYLE
ncbi:MAG: bifunctional oligoribonuclease/PAP phosphatase NrnA [Clostridia bacterium]|nr:bifunctional oligoribonuclease/PAP phosphatase NrnA [Clostridia bacterium]